MTDLVCKVGDRSIASAYVDAPQPYRHGMPWLLSEPLYASRLEELAGDMQLLVLKLWIIPRFCHTDFLSAKLRQYTC